MHLLPARYLNRPLEINLVGCGGNGSQMLSGLARLHLALLELGRKGLHVQAWDPDTVTAANVGRQLFSRADIGQNKAVVLIHRINAYHGLDWTAMPTKFHGFHRELLIGCVDSAKARREISKRHNDYWLDLGNTQQTGQVVLGYGVPSWPDYLPSVLDLFPDLANPKRKEDNSPSCSLAEALDKQDLFINQAVATAALHLLWGWFRTGALQNHGAFINLDNFRTTPLPIDRDQWLRMNPKLKLPEPEPTAQAA